MDAQTQPQTIHYQLLECIGQGLNSRVFRALREDSGLHIRQPVAIKILNSENLVEIWKKEFLSLSRVRSPHCVSVLGFDWIERQPALVLELVEGFNLGDLTRNIEWSKEELEEIAAQCYQGLKDLSQAGLCHGDLSLNNIMINNNGCVLLLDFGLANNSDAHAQTTVQFAAPEILAGVKPDLQTDLYSLQKIIEHMCSSQNKKGYLNVQDCVSQSHVKRQLAEKVQEYQIQLQQSAQTVVLHKPRHEAFGLLRLAMLFILLTCGLSLRGEAWLDSRPAHLSIRTNRWLLVTINGQDIGYAPFEGRAIATGKVEIGFRHNRGAGHRTLTITKGQHIVLGNSFFGL